MEDSRLEFHVIRITAQKALRGLVNPSLRTARALGGFTI